MKKYVKLYGIIAIGVIAGAIGGYLYWHYVGCLSGTCAITSKPLNSTLYGGLMGGLILNMFTNNKKKNDVSRID